MGEFERRLRRVLFFIGMIGGLCFSLNLAFAVPNQSQAQAVNLLVQVLQKNNVESFWDAFLLFGCHERLLENYKIPRVPHASSSEKRLASAFNTILEKLKPTVNPPSQIYIYSRQWGWVDLRHFFSAAAATEKLHFLSLVRFSNTVVLAPQISYFAPDWITDWILTRGEHIEASQMASGFPSAWNYEDLTSNALGTFIAGQTSLNTFFRLTASSKNFPNNLGKILRSLGFVNDLAIAPNWKDLPKTPREANAASVFTHDTYEPIYTDLMYSDANRAANLPRISLAYQSSVLQSLVRRHGAGVNMTTHLAILKLN